MKLPDSEFTEESLIRFGEEAASLLKLKDFQTLASRFGYALAFDRNQSEAIEEDLHHCLERKNDRSSHRPAPKTSIAVKYFKPNDTNLLAVVECVIELENVRVLVELIAAQNGKEKTLYLEDINNVD